LKEIRKRSVKNPNIRTRESEWCTPNVGAAVLDAANDTQASPAKLKIAAQPTLELFCYNNTLYSNALQWFGPPNVVFANHGSIKYYEVPHKPHGRVVC